MTCMTYFYNIKKQLICKINFNIWDGGFYLLEQMFYNSCEDIYFFHFFEGMINMRKVYNWNEFWDTFLKAGHHSKISLKVISEMFEVPYQSVRRRAAAEKWHQRRLYLWYEENATNIEKC
jgi:hypothetical protein